MAGRSQHLSRLIQLKLQIMSNIWSWNCTTEEGKRWRGVTNSSHILRRCMVLTARSPPVNKKHAQQHPSNRPRPYFQAVVGTEFKVVRWHARYVLSLRFKHFIAFLFHLLLRTASLRLQTWPSCQAPRSHPAWCFWPPWWASLPPLGSPRSAWLSPGRRWCGAAGGRGGWEGTIKENHICLPDIWQVQHVLLAWAELNTRAFEEPFGHHICFYLQSGITVHDRNSKESP